MKLDRVAEKIAAGGEASGGGGDDGSDVKDVKENDTKVDDEVKPPEKDDSTGVGDKIKKFERAAEDAGAGAGRVARAGSVRARARDVDPPGPPPGPLPDPPAERPAHHNANNTSSNLPGAKWTKAEFETPKIKKPEPQKVSLIKPEFKPIQSPVDVTIRSPSLGAKLGEQFASQGTAFRNVAAEPRPNETHKFNDDVNTQSSIRTGKIKKEKFSVSKGSSYFTRGSEDMWLVKKKDIEEIEERVLDSFMRAGGGVCGRGEVGGGRPASDGGHAAATHTLGRAKRPAYARSESLDPQLAGARSQTLKRQTSVACTCGHDKNKARSKSSCDAAARPRSRSHGDDNAQTHVLDKYETLV